MGANKTGIRIGVGEADITPPLGTQIAGDVGRIRPAEEIRGRLFVRALVADDGKKRICLIAMEALGITKPHAERLRRMVAELLGTVPAAVMVHGHQSHSSPMVGDHALHEECTLVPEGSWLRGGGGAAYVEQFMESALAAVKAAEASLQLATIKVGRAMEGRVAHNRRFVMRDGTVKTHPPVCSPDILHAEGPVDPEVGVALICNSSDKPFAALLHFTCHPVHGYPQRWVSPDWPGAWADKVREMLGGEIIPLVVNGCCGNVHHCNHINPQNQEFDTIERMAECLAESTQTALDRLQPIGTSDLDFRSSRLDLPWRVHPAEKNEQAKAMLAEHPTPPFLDKEKTIVPWDWVFAAGLLDVLDHQSRHPRCDLEVQVFRFGELALAGWPGEPFVEGQLAVKKDSPFSITFMAHWCNDAISYIGTDRAYENGGFEVELPWCRLGPGALDAMREETLRMLKELNAS